MSEYDQDIARAIDRLASTWATFAGETPGAELSHDDLLVRRWADSEFSFWNMALVPAVSSAALPASLAAGADLAAKKRYAGFVAVTEDQLIRLGEARNRVVAEAGLAEVASFTEMTGLVPIMSLAELRATIQFERVSDRHALRALADMNAQAYGLTNEVARAGIAGAPATWMEAAYSYLAREDGEVRSVASVLPHDGWLYLGLVATRPDFQRRGLASITVSHALREASAATGLKRTDLHATAAGAPVYPRLGYKPRVVFKLLQLQA